MNETKKYKLIPDIPEEEEIEESWVIIEDTDVIERRKLTLKEIKKLCEERDIGVLGPKGGQLTKKVLLERLEADIEREHQEEVAKAKEEASIVRQYNENKITVMETNLKRLRKEMQIEADILSKQQTKCGQMDAKANELRISIKTLKELL